MPPIVQYLLHSRTHILTHASVRCSTNRLSYTDVDTDSDDAVRGTYQGPVAHNNTTAAWHSHNIVYSTANIQPVISTVSSFECRTLLRSLVPVFCVSDVSSNSHTFIRPIEFTIYKSDWRAILRSLVSAFYVSHAAPNSCEYTTIRSLA
jgi:hypothetical protein